MKKMLILGLAILLSGLMFGQQNAPTMSFTKVKHDFGNIRQEDGPAKVTFEFTNTGGSPVIISDVTASCGCTTPSWSRQPVPPGAKGFIEAAYNPENRPGSFNKTITVKSNASNSPVTLTITGNVLEKQNSMVQQYPNSIGDLRIDKIYLNFGNMYSDEVKELEFNVYNPTDKNVTISFDEKFTPNYIDITVERDNLAPKQESKITVKYDASKVNDWDYVRGFMYLTIDGQKITNPRLQVSAIIKEKFTDAQKANPPVIEFEESEFDFGTIKQGEVIEHVFTYKNTGKSDLVIRKTRTSCGCTAVNVDSKPVAPGQTGELKIRFNSAGKVNRQVKTITIVTNCPDPNKNTIVLKLTGTVNQ